MNQQVTHAYQIRFPLAFWHRINRYVRASVGYPTVQAFVIDAVERRLRELEGMGPTFTQAWEASHSGLPPELHEKAAAYRCAPPTPRHAFGQIFVPELLEHFYAERWDMRTAVLIRQQLDECRKRQLPVKKAPLDPPGFSTPNAWPATLPTVTDSTDSDEDENNSL